MVAVGEKKLTNNFKIVQLSFKGLLDWMIAPASSPLSSPSLPHLPYLSPPPPPPPRLVFGIAYDTSLVDFENIHKQSVSNLTIETTNQCSLFGLELQVCCLNKLSYSM